MRLFCNNEKNLKKSCNVKSKLTYTLYQTASFMIWMGIKYAIISSFDCCVFLKQCENNEVEDNNPKEIIVYKMSASNSTTLHKKSKIMKSSMDEFKKEPMDVFKMYLKFLHMASIDSMICTPHFVDVWGMVTTTTTNNEEEKKTPRKRGKKNN